MTRKLVGIIGSGLVGTDPYDENAWSGSSRYFFSECQRQGVLHRAFGVEVRNLIRIPLIARNISVRKHLWRWRFYLDTRYYHFLTKEIVANLSAKDLAFTLFQIGGIFHLRPFLSHGATLFSYHDGNLAEAIRSPYFPKGVGENRIKKALDYERRVYDSVDKILTMSDYLKKSFVEDFNVDERRIVTVGAGMNMSAIPSTVEKDFEKKNILFVGVDFARKGGMDLLRAFRIVRETHRSAILHVVGPRRLRIPAELSNGVEFHGFLSKMNDDQNTKLEQLMRDASLFVLPSLYEPFGIAAIEAMAYRIPCILSDSWAFPEMVSPGVNGELVRCGDFGALAETMSSLLGDAQKLSDMGTEARRTALNKYTWEAVVGRIKNMSV